MASLQNSPSLSRTLSPNSFPQIGLQRYHSSFPCCRRGFSFVVRAHQSLAHAQVKSRRRQLIAVSVIAPWVSLVNQTSFAAETKKGFLLVTDKKDGYSFLYPFGWQIAETLIKKVLAPPSQKTKLIEASEHDVDGKAYYTFEFIAQAPNYTRHALSTISIGNGKFYTLTTGANERRWDKMKDKLHAVVDSFNIFSV
ncbi:psbP-like protein 1, chloroplastic isoform X3 [Manihot esculenta]|uniref:psbP-like protein 1, chloroplastic isoform X3 n=1 Tax=Manihot esculenta TaxID=3983 RepID=UPI000B5D4DB2|nr:psbP-like protein 1, chloroplastic isoform X3 [Manihot esculenta]